MTMARYHVDHRYASSTFGPWVEGDHVELSPEEAKWVNHDSEGTLTLVDPQAQAAAKRKLQDEAEERRRAEQAPKQEEPEVAPAPKRRGRPPGSGTRKAT